MKKYLFGLSALIMAVAFSAFTKPNNFATEVFRFDLAKDANSASDIQNVANWQRVGLSVCTPNVNDKVCEIIVSDQFYTVDGEDINLNATDPDGNGSEEQMLIVASSSQTFSSGTFKYVISSGTTGTPANLDLAP